MENAFKTILYRYFFQETFFFIIIFAIALIALFVMLIKKKRGKALITSGVILGLSIVAILSTYISIQLDINKNDIVQVGYSQGYIYTQSKHKELSLATPYYFKTDEGYNVELSVVDGIPNKLENGTIIYSKHSQVLLDYTGKEIED